MQPSSLSASLLSPPDTPDPPPRQVKAGWLVRWFDSHFQDSRSQLAAVLAFLGALAVSIYWLIWIVEQRWMYSNQHPVQSVSFEPVQSLPAIIGMHVIFSRMLAHSNYTLFRRVIPKFIQPWPVNLTSVACTDTHFLDHDSAICQQVIDGQPALLVGAPPGELDGASSAHFDLSSLPLQYTRDDKEPGELCLEVHLMQNRTALDAASLFDPPVVIISSLSARATLSEVELVAAGHTSYDDPVSASNFPLNGNEALTFTGYYNLRKVTNAHFSATKTVQVDGSSQLDLVYEAVGDYAISPKSLQSAFETLLSTVQNETVRAELVGWRADPDVEYNVGSFCAQPRNFLVQVIRLQRLYGWGSFLSDAGGFLNILTIALLILFPVTYRVVQPRSFLPLFLLIQWRERKPPMADPQSNSKDVQLRPHAGLSKHRHDGDEQSHN